MTKRILLVLAVLVAASSLSFGAACANASLTAYTAGGFTCTLDIANQGGGLLTVTFSNFTVGGGLAASIVNVSVTTNMNGLNGFGFAAATGSSFVAGNTIAYRVAITGCTGGNPCNLVQVQEQMNSLVSSSNPSTAGIVYSALSPGGAAGPVNLNALVFGNLTGGSALPGGTQAVTRTITLNPSANATFAITSLESDITGFIQTGIPEPTTLSLLGAGLAMAGLIGRKRLSK